MFPPLLLYCVLLSQIVLISWVFPAKLQRRARYVLDRYPPTEYPKLYAAPVDAMERGLRRYRTMNRFALLAGGFLLLVGFLGHGEALFRWNGGSVIGVYALLQYAPLLIAVNAGFPYFSSKRRPDTGTTRSTELRPRHLFDFVSPTLIGVAALTYLGFVALILYVRQFQFPWFGGYWNIAIMTGMNLLFAALIYRLLYGKPRDPYQAYPDRIRQIGREVRILVLTSIAATVFVALNVALHAFDLGDLIPISLSVYIQLLSLIGLRQFRIDETDFEVYREAPLAT